MNDTDLSRLDALAGWMRASGAVRVVVSSDRVELELGVAPPPAPEAPRELTAEERQAQVRAEKEATDRLLGLRE